MVYTNMFVNYHLWYIYMYIYLSYTSAPFEIWSFFNNKYLENNSFKLTSEIFWDLNIKTEGIDERNFLFVHDNLEIFTFHNLDLI